MEANQGAQTTRTDSTKILPARQANSETLIFWQVFGPRDWFSRLRLELECLKMASDGEKLGFETESAESGVRCQILLFGPTTYLLEGGGRRDEGEGGGREVESRCHSAALFISRHKYINFTRCS